MMFDSRKLNHSIRFLKSSEWLSVSFKLTLPSQKIFFCGCFSNRAHSNTTATYRAGLEALCCYVILVKISLFQFTVDFYTKILMMFEI